MTKRQREIHQLLVAGTHRLCRRPGRSGYRLYAGPPTFNGGSSVSETTVRKMLASGVLDAELKPIVQPAKPG